MKRSFASIERPLLLGTVVATLFGVVILIISVSTSYWVHLTTPGVFRNSSQAYIISHHSGLWRICRTEIYNLTEPSYRRTTCNLLKLFPSTDALDEDPEVDAYILNYSRSETAFAVLSLIFAVIAHLFAFYAMREPRYMFKRLTGVIHIFTAVSVLVSAEVFMNSVDYEREHLKQRHPEGSSITYGFSFVIIWLAFVIYLVAAIVFFICSKKRKGDKARTEKEAMENEPIHLGRI